MVKIMMVYPEHAPIKFKDGYQAIASYNGVLKYVRYNASRGRWHDENGDNVIPDFLLQFCDDIYAPHIDTKGEITESLRSISKQIHNIAKKLNIGL